MVNRFEPFAELYVRRCLKATWFACPNYLDDPWDSLWVFLKGYAFERQGRPEDFQHAAVDAIDEVRAQGLDAEAAVRAWTAFTHRLRNAGLNHASNPMCPRDTAYTRQHRGRAPPAVVGKISAVEFAQEQLAGEPMVAWVRRMLESDQVQEAHKLLRRINGIGPKIASFFLRDVATRYDLTPAADRALLQPIDKWVRFVARHLGGHDLDDAGYAAYIVGNADEPERANQGAWYFCARIADSSEYLVRRSLADEEHFQDLVFCHLERLRDDAGIAETFRQDWDAEQ